MPVPVHTIQSASTPVSPPELAIIGDGKVSLAIASMLAASGQAVRLWSSDGSAPEECEVRERNARVGHVRGRTRFTLVSDQIGNVLKGAPVVLLSVPAIEYGATLSALAPQISSGQTILLAEAPLGAALQFTRLLNVARPGMQVNVLEMGRLYDSVKIEGSVALLIGPRKRVSICGLSRNETHRGLLVVSSLWGGLVPASNVLERGFAEVERLIRTALRLFRIVSPKGAETPKSAGLMTPAMVSIISALAGELQAVAREFAVPLPGLAQTLVDYTGAAGSSLSEMLSGLADFMLEDGSTRQSVDSLRKKLRRDVTETFVLIEEFARLARLPVPVIDSIIQLASVVTECDLRKDGRGLSDLGLVGVDVRELIDVVNG
jgi:opine dehydrogenase